MYQLDEYAIKLFKGGNSLFDNISLTNYLKLLEVNNIRFTENDDVRFQQM